MAENIIEKFDDAGIFTSFFDESAPMYNAKKLSEYCKQHNKSANELSDDELKILQTN